MMSIFFQGFFLQASLILALGAQNIFVLQSGLRRERHLVVALVSSLCDTFLVMVGVLGVATIFLQLPKLKIGLATLGVIFLLYYGLKKLLEARKPMVVAASLEAVKNTKRAIFLSLGFSLLNPHVYLDTVVLIGGYSSQFSLLSQRLAFGVGASVFSTIWFFGLATSASAASGVLGNPKAMRFVSLCAGLILIGLAFQLGFDLWNWTKSFPEKF